MPLPSASRWKYPSCVFDECPYDSVEHAMRMKHDRDSVPCFSGRSRIEESWSFLMRHCGVPFEALENETALLRL